jgi:S1-C subfamily serine protease
MMVGELRAGDQATFTVIRDGTSREVRVRIEARTDEVVSDSKKLWPGVIVVPITDDIRSSQDLDRNAKGLFVARVEGESPAHIIGLRQGDLINSVNGETCNDIRAFYRLLREKTTAELWFGFTRSSSELETLKFKR